LKTTQSLSFPAARRLAEQTLGPVTYAAVASLPSQPRQTPRERLQLDPQFKYSKFKHQNSSQADSIDSSVDTNLPPPTPASPPADKDTSVILMDTSSVASPSATASVGSPVPTSSSAAPSQSHHSSTTGHPFLDSYKSDRNLEDSRIEKILPSVIKVLESCGFKSSIRVLTNRRRLPPDKWPPDRSNAATELEQLIHSHVLQDPGLKRDQNDILTVLLLHEMYPTALRLVKHWLHL